MKTLFAVVALIVAGHASADQYVNGYTRSDGTYVQGHTKSTPDQYRSNNYGSQSYGGSQRDEYSAGGGATNRSNSSWGSRDNDRDGIPNAYDQKPNSKHNCPSGYAC